MWKNRQYATHRMTFDPAQLQVEGEPPVEQADVVEPERDNEFGPGRRCWSTMSPAIRTCVVPAGQRARYEAAFARFCRVFPDAFYVSERGRDYFDTDARTRAAISSAGFHNMMGYFRDDRPLYELILDEQAAGELDALWQELDFVTSAPDAAVHRASSGSSGPTPRFMREPEFDFARAEDKDVTSEAKIKQLAEVYLAKAAQRRQRRGDRRRSRTTSTTINDEHPLGRAGPARRPSRATSRRCSTFAERAYRRPLTPAERDELARVLSRAARGATA